MNDNIISVLISMGYRFFKEGVYAKPVGFSLYIFSKPEDEWELVHWFKGADDNPYRWSSAEIDITLEKEELLEEFICAENGIVYQQMTYADNSFLTLTQMLEL